MKTVLAILLAIPLCAYAQGTFIYDQQSATNAAPGGGAAIAFAQPMGQSFTPTLSSIDFVQLEFSIAGPSNQLGTTVFVNLWSGSISNGTLLGSTTPVFVSDNAFNQVTSLSFSSTATLTPGDTYFLQPYIESGDTRLGAIASEVFDYAGGTAYFYGEPDPNNQDLWFREGVYAVPEPSTIALILLGGIGTAFARRRFLRKQS